MKYIRTKDGIYERMFPDCETQRISFDHKTIEPAYYTTKNDWIAKKDVVKQADTIEELCDCYVIIGSGSYQKYIKSNIKDALKKKEWLKKLGYSCQIYGSIWTGADLHSVAKMNEEGELELL